MKRIIVSLALLFLCFGISADSQVISVVGGGAARYQFTQKAGYRPASGYFTTYETSLSIGMISSSSIEFLSKAHHVRVRQNGSIGKLQFYFGTKDALLTGVFVKVWRRDGGTYDLVGTSENILAAITATATNTITLATPIQGVQEGDYLAWRLEASAPVASQQFAGTTLASNARIFYVTNSVPSATDFNWDGQSPVTNTYLKTKAFMVASKVVFIGYSHIAGGTDHKSFCSETLYDTEDTSTYTHLDSTIERQFAALTGVTYQNMGIGGNKALDIQSRVTNDMTALFPSVAVIQLGGQFSGAGADLDRPTSITLNAATAILDTCLARSIKPVLLSISPVVSYSNAQCAKQDSLNTMLENLCQTHAAGAVWVDVRRRIGLFNAAGPLLNFWDSKASYTEGDATHYTSRANYWIAKRILQELNRSTVPN